MKKNICFFLVTIFITSALRTQLSDRVVTDTMTLSQAKYALQVEMATINHYFFRDYYGDELKERFGRDNSIYYKSKAFELNDIDSIRHNLINYKWGGSYWHVRRIGGSRINYSYSTHPKILNKAGLREKEPNYKTYPKKIYYANKTTEERSDILTDNSWYNNLKAIDSILIDLKILYPTSIEVVNIPIEPEKYEQSIGGFIWLAGYDGKYLDMAVTENIFRNTTTIHCINEEGVRKAITKNQGPQQPSSEMFNYASKSYMFCKALVQNIDNGKYKSVKALKNEYESLHPTEPDIKFIIRNAYKIPKDTKSIEYRYYATYDSIMIPRVMIHPSFPRKCNYAVIEQSTGSRIIRGIVDLNGKWIIKPDYMIVEEVAGIFYEVGDVVRGSKELVRVDETRKAFIPVDFEVVENIDNIFLVISRENKKGVIDRNGKTIIPIEFPSLSYNKALGLFIVKTNHEAPQYQLYKSDGKLALTKKYRLIEIINDNIYTTEIKNDEEIITTYDRNLKKTR